MITMPIAKHNPLSHLHILGIPLYHLMCHSTMYMYILDALLSTRYSLYEVLICVLLVGWRIIISVATFFDIALILFSLSIGLLSSDMFSTYLFPLCWRIFVAV